MEDPHPTPGTLACQMAMQETLRELSYDIRDIKTSISEVKEILSAWNSIKGFGKTLSWVAKGIKIVTIIAGGLAVVWYFVTRGSVPPPGN